MAVLMPAGFMIARRPGPEAKTSSDVISSSPWPWNYVRKKMDLPRPTWQPGKESEHPEKDLEHPRLGSKVAKTIHEAS